MSPVRNATRLLPLEVAVAGRKRNALFHLLDPLFRASTRNDIIATPWGPPGTGRQSCAGAPAVLPL